MPDLVFPDGFMWGAASSSYQIEGGNKNADWWGWGLAGGGAEPCGEACDSWNLWREDIEAAVSLGLGVHRISIEWSRVEPQQGRFDEAAIATYVEMLATARHHGLETMVVFWHFTNPVWLGDMPWTRPEHVDAFETYVRRVVPALAPHVDHWATINEANTFAWHGYVIGDWPPQRTDDWPSAVSVYRSLGAAHVRARAAIKELLGDDVAVGLTHVLAWPHPAEKGAALSGVVQWWWRLIGNDLFLDRVARRTDWLGVQYYHDTPCRTFGVALDDGCYPRTDMGWRIAPEGLYQVVMGAWRRYGVPIIVTENGLADAADAQRGRFIIDHLAWLHRAIEEGADVRGYVHWSLLDNFEWAEGFGPRFGLVEVDYETFARTPRESALLYARIVKENRIAAGLGDELRYADGKGSLGPAAP